MSKIPKDMKQKNKMQEMFEDNPELKQVFFFGFYIVFFVFIVILLRSSFTTANSKVTRSNSGYGTSFKLKELENENYHFNYKITKNKEVTIYDGNKNKEMQEFIKSGAPSTNYYSKEGKYYIRNINTLLYEESPNPMEFEKLLTLNNLKKFFIHGSYTARTEYINDSGEDYIYEISTSTMLRNIDNIEVDVAGESNKVTVKLDKNGVLSEIEMNLTDYFHYFDQSINEYKLVISYSKFDEIDTINSEY